MPSTRAAFPPARCAPAAVQFDASPPHDSSNLQQQLLQNGLLEVIEADRLNEDMSFAADDVPAIIYVEAFGRLWRENIFGRLHDNWQAIDNYAFRNQCVASVADTSNTQVIIAIPRNINNLSAARKLLVELAAAE